MKIFEVLIIAIALSLDAFISMTANYSAYNGAGVKGKLFAVFLISILHAVFALFGYVISTSTGLSNTTFFEYAVIVLYLLLALKALLDKEEEKHLSIDGKKCFMQAVVTSFDAFVGGITLSADSNVATMIFIAIFVVTLVMVVLGLALGRFLERKPKTLAKSVSASLFLALAIKSIVA
jgi:putative Mn2+ efflux pump MntP